MKRLPAVLAGAVCTCKYCFVLPELRWRSESGATGRIRCFWCRGHCPNWGHYRSLAPGLIFPYSSHMLYISNHMDVNPGSFGATCSCIWQPRAGSPKPVMVKAANVMLYFRPTSMKTFRREVQACSFEVGFEQNFVLNWREKWRCGETSWENSTSSGLPWILRNILVPGSVPCPFEGQCGTQIFHVSEGSLGMSREMLEKRIRIKCEPILMCNFCSTRVCICFYILTPDIW